MSSVTGGFPLLFDPLKPGVNVNMYIMYNVRIDSNQSLLSLDPGIFSDLKLESKAH